MAISPDVKSVTPHEALSRLYTLSPAFYVDPDHTIAAVNKPAKWLWDRSANELLGTSFDELYSDGNRRIGLGSGSPARYRETHAFALEQTKDEKNFTHYPFDMIDPSPHERVLQRYNVWVADLRRFGMGSVVEIRPDRITDRFGQRKDPLDDYHDDLSRRHRLGDEQVKYVDTVDRKTVRLLKTHAPHQDWQQKECGLHIIREVGEVHQKVWSQQEVDEHKAQIQAEDQQNLDILLAMYPASSEYASQFKTIMKLETHDKIEQLTALMIPKPFNPRSVQYSAMGNRRRVDTEEWWKSIPPLYPQFL